RVGGGRLDGLLTQSPHTPVAGCTTTFSGGGRWRILVLTNTSHDFVAWIGISVWGDGTVMVIVKTTEAPAARVSEDAPFKDRYPVTTQLARVALGRVAPYVFDGQVQQQQDDDDDDSDGHGGGWDDMDDDSDGEDSGGEDASAAQENSANDGNASP
ncbi:unnamed protein product, partial [Vitrella brassicaformis CCMP3155]